MQRSNSELCRKFAAICPHCIQFKTAIEDMTLAGLRIALETLPMPFPHLRWNNHIGQFTAYYFVTFVAKNALSSWVKFDQPAMHIRSNNAVQCCIDDGAHFGLAAA